jgi:hypothetical protein
VTKTFKPPTIENLASIDAADCVYSPEIVDIIGLVAYSSQSGWPQCAEYEVHCFEFAAWHPLGKPVVKKILTILRPVQAVSDAFNDYPAGTIHHIQVILSGEQKRAVFVKKIRDIQDIELAEIANELQKPVVVHTDRFGPLALDRSINWFTGTANWNGQVISLRIVPNENLDLTEQLTIAEVLFSDSVGWGEKVQQFALQEQLALANDWQDEEITPEEFLQRMTLETIVINSNGHFEFWHDDGDLFWGHSIQISGSITTGLTTADIPG